MVTVRTAHRARLQPLCGPMEKPAEAGGVDVKKISLFWTLFSVWKSHLGVQ